MEVALIAPPAQHMKDASIEAILAPHKAVLIRQKLDKMEMICPGILQKDNKYKVAFAPPDKLKDLKDGSKTNESADDWEDKHFKKALKHGEIVTLKEKSSCMGKFCCGSYREFSMKMNAGDDVAAEGNLGTMFRPFKCTILLCGLMLFNPQELTVSNREHKRLGKITQKWILPGSCCCSRYWSVTDDEGKKRYLISQKFFCNTNQCAPSLFCPVHTIEINTPDGNEKVGEINNFFPGCGWKKFWRLQGDADNFMIRFPKDATPADKALLLGANILIDYMVFEKAPDNDGLGGGVDF